MQELFSHGKQENIRIEYIYNEGEIATKNKGNECSFHIPSQVRVRQKGAPVNLLITFQDLICLSENSGGDND